MRHLLVTLLVGLALAGCSNNVPAGGETPARNAENTTNMHSNASPNAPTEGNRTSRAGTNRGPNEKGEGANENK